MKLSVPEVPSMINSQLYVSLLTAHLAANQTARYGRAGLSKRFALWQAPEPAGDLSVSDHQVPGTVISGFLPYGYIFH
jgi:hypothetical protein